MTEQPAATLRSRYVEQAASDLEENHRRQQELTEKIALLKQEAALLSDILKLAERYECVADTSHQPEQTQDKPAAAATVRRSTGTKAASGAKGKSPQPLLGDLLMELLAKYDEPRPAKELRDELLEKHPSRNPTPQVVRNTIESLVAKGRVQRHKRQRSVMYTLVKP
ncbi:hypothetical protein [Streptomyces sp. NPDC050264]|uniref:hypothetical protein n=1 Tax=Streptomyces sp. NPDC050264 TaxID=3155038 RepID=UPI003429A543